MFANESIKNSLSCSSFVVNFRYCAADYVGQSYIRVTNSVDFFLRGRPHIREARRLSGRKQTRAAAYLGRFCRRRARRCVPGAAVGSNACCSAAVMSLYWPASSQLPIQLPLQCWSWSPAVLASLFRSRNQRRRTVRVWCAILLACCRSDPLSRVCTVCSGRS